MKILRAYIENFGKLSKKEFNFNDGLNTIIEENGYGKTTLATFIKAMFYGMKSTTKKQLDENEKRKYSPWQGGNYGGYLEFMVGENKYRVERFFGKKDSEDSFLLTDLKTGKESNKYSERLGEELFGLDEESYERCVFVPEKDIEATISDKLSLKLINMIQGTSNKDSYEKAVNIIKEKSQELKKRGNTGKIAEVENEIAEISEEIDLLKSSADVLNSFEIDLIKEDDIIKELIKDKQEISDKIKLYGEEQALIANKKYYDDKKQLKLSLEKEIEEKQNILNHSNINENDLKDIASKSEEIIKTKTLLDALKEETSNDKKYQELNNLFGDIDISTEEIDLVIAKEQRLKEVKNQIDLNICAVSNNETKPKKNLFTILFAVLSLTSLSLGLIFLSNTTICTIAFVFSGVMAIFSIISFFKNRSFSAAMEKPKLFSANLNELIKEKENLEKEIQAFLLMFKNCEVANLTLFLYDLRSKIGEFYILKQEINKKHENFIKLKESLNLLEKQINAFFDKFNIDNNLSAIDKIALIKDSLNRLNQVEKELREIDGILAQYEERDVKHLDIENIDISVLQESESSKQKEIDIHRDRKVDKVRKIDKIKDKISELDELENQLEEKTGLRNELKNEYKILNLVNQYLTQANDNLTAKYKKPMQDNLNKYLNLLLQNNNSSFDIDTELNVTFEEFGKRREVDYLSKGYQGAINICTRFALIDSLFEKEKPFVILDDPFVNLDSQKIGNSLNILKELAKEHQIIYFTCHESRI